MALDTNRIRKFLKEFDLKNLFVEELGWNHYNNQIEVTLDGNSFHLSAVAEKHGMAAFTCNPSIDGHIPNYELRRKIEKQAAKSIHEHIIIYTDKNKTTQIWQWVKREAGKPIACREHPYHINQPGDSLIQKLQSIAFSLEDEESLTIVEVAGRARAAFDVERITKKFYDRFKTEHDAFLKFIDGIPDDELHRWYASVMLNRLMFIYFIQKKGFLDSDDEYLKNKLLQCKAHGKDTFYNKFLCPLFFEGFAKKKSERSATVNKLLGDIPYLNGGLFLKHQIEELHGKHIAISDKAFEKLFDFFDQYQWHLDERPLRQDNEINPDVLGYIFEKYINQKQMGAYYTKEDITEYISKNTVIPFLFDAAKQKCKIAFEGESAVWKLLQADPDRYFYPAVKKGVELPLPPEIEAGIKDISKRTEWNKPASAEYALPTEIWREVVARRQRYEEVRGKMLHGEIQSINDLITYNLDIRQFAQDVIVDSEGPELLRAFYHAIENVTVLDPTCGSGAFLFAALNILEPLYEACLDRMQVFVNELDRSEEKHRPEKYSDFKKILKRASEHPNLKYFIYKSIIVNNLYGVDIMEEAIEICKLRLFLKLVAQIEGAEHMEPLPDIEINIRAGNTLVGFANLEEIKKAMEGDWIKLQSLPVIEENAELADRAFRLFKEMQTDQEMQSEDFSSAKLELRKRLNQLEDELNRYLANDYGVDPKKKTAYEKWHKSHRPFHWFIEFYGILKSGGFNVIIGNPPFVENTPSKVSYSLSQKTYSTLACGNLYAFVSERCFNLCNKNGLFSFIMPAASLCTPRMGPLLSALHQRYALTWLSVWDERPSKLFDGVDQQLSIHVCKGSESLNSTWITQMRHWSSEERESLFPTLSYARIATSELVAGALPKLGLAVEQVLLAKLQSVPHILSGTLMRVQGGSMIYYRNAGGRYWRLIKTFPSYFRSGAGATATSTEKTFLVAKAHAALCVALFSSSLFYWFWRICSNCRHLTDRELEAFPIAKPIFEQRNATELEHLSVMFERQLRQTKQRQTTENKRSGTVVQDVYLISTAKPIIDEIDRVLAKHYGFTDEELDFIINYDIKYRMGRESGEED